ncbi:MAG TPA: hypothetical protein VK846_17045 [Candidatus Limnocylindria bacterium]|nr:hypothetical protein [Candidatus Limnocylindria bacterium]
MPSRAKKLLLLALAAVFITANGLLQPVLNRQRGELGITHIEPLENAPPMLALTTQVLGGFRGLIANALWIRTTHLQEDGKYFEMVQLADWITKLEPRFAQVWIVQAWNMAFNISVKFSDYGDRWRWVQRGIELLRDEGLRYNPEQPLLYADLAWLFQFKMGQNLDDGHFYYKLAWATEMMDVFGGQQPNFDRLSNPQTPEEKERARVLREKYKLDPARMKMLNERYGPLDWRLPEAHAIYWSSLGMDRAKGEDVRRLRSGIYQSMNLSFQRGRLVLSTNAPPRFLPNLAIVPKVDAAYREQIAEAPDFLTNNMARAYRNFLRDVPYQFFLVNRLTEGEQWMRYLRQQFPDSVPTNTTLAEFAVSRAMDNAQEQSQNKVTALLYGFIERAYWAAIEGNADEFYQYMNLADQMLTAYTTRNKSNQRVAVASLQEFQRIVRNGMLAPDSRLTPEEKTLLRANTGEPGATAAPTPK